MKKIPTLFKRSFQNHKVIGISDQVEEGLEWVLKGEGIATVKVDGSCCAIFDGVLYKRYDAKKGKPIPEGAIKCQEEPDPITGHLPCWVKCSEDNPSDKWFIVAFNELLACTPRIFHDNHTYEAIGPHFQGNPYHLERDILVCHGLHVMENCPRTFEGLKRILKETPIEGIVFWKDNEPRCKIKRTDFGFEWPCEDAVLEPEFEKLYRDILKNKDGSTVTIPIQNVYKVTCSVGLDVDFILIRAASEVDAWDKFWEHFKDEPNLNHEDFGAKEDYTYSGGYWKKKGSIVSITIETINSTSDFQYIGGGRTV